MGTEGKGLLEALRKGFFDYKGRRNLPTLLALNMVVVAYDVCS